MALADLYAHSADGRVELYWRRTSGSGSITVQHALDSSYTSPTTATSGLSSSATAYSVTLTNSTTPRWFRVSDDGGTSWTTFDDPAYANSGKFKDANGWYVVPLAAGKVCRFYSSATATPAGSDANDGLGIATPKLNYSSGAQTGGDHQLLKRGETFSTGGILLGTNGPSSTSLSVIGAYGPSSVARPILSASAGNNVIIVDLTNTRSHFAILHLDMRFTTRDGDNATCLYWLDGGTGATDGLISGCRGFQGDSAFVFNGIGSNITGLICHRCVATDCYSVGGEGVADSSGFFAAYCDSPVFEDCYSLDCGYLASNRSTYPNTPRNHAYYLSEHSLNYTFRNCVALGNDSQLRGGGIYERLLGINCPVGFNTAATNNNSGTFVAENAIVQDSWFDGSSDISGTAGYERGWGARLGANDQTAIGLITVKDTGFNLSSGNGGITTGTNIQPVNYDRQAGANVGNVTLDGIVVVDSEPINEAYGLVHLEHPPVTFRMVRSVLDVPTSSPILSHLSAIPTNWQLGSNSYYSPTTDGTTYNSTWFYDQDATAGLTVAAWASYVGDPYSGFSASLKEVGGHHAFTAKRRITDYCSHVGLGATVSAWKSACDGQRRGAWSTAYTAEYAIDWIRAGYDMPALLTAVPDVPTSPGTTVDSDTQITFTWTPSLTATSHEVRISAHGAETWTETDDLADDANSKVYSGLDVGGSYDFQVRARNATGASEWTGIVTATTTAPGGGGAGSPPTLDSVVANGPTSITCSWTPTDGGTAAGYQLEYKLHSDSTWVTVTINNPATHSHQVTGLTEGSQYDFRIKVI